MKAITLWQPWASMIAIGCKTHETRSWSTFHRGPIAIHAAKRFYEDELIFARGVIRAHKPIQDAMRKHGMSCLADFPLGAIVAVVDIVDIIPSEKIDSTDAINYKLGDFTP
ncbi:MAG TPA: ASCH domain-containing protein, partial [Pseudomonadales bacterium]|nr:ASCH domain-containing protein [Pseudomonadales bacterium]